MRPSFFLGAFVLVLMLVGSSDAEHCTTWSTSNPEVDEFVLTGTYIDNDLCQPDCLFSMWFYQESNGIPGLQRGDEVVDDTCHGMIESDTIWCWILPVGLMTPRDRKEKKGGYAAMAGIGLLAATAFVPTAEAC